MWCWVVGWEVPNFFKPEGRWFDFWWCHRNFSLTRSFRPHYGPGVDSACNRNEYRGYFLSGKGVRCVGLTTLPPMCQLSWNLGPSPSWNPLGLSRPVVGLLYRKHSPNNTCYFPEDLNLQVRCCKILKSQALRYLSRVSILMEMCAETVSEPSYFGCSAAHEANILRVECVMFSCRWEVLPSYQQGCGSDGSEESTANWRNRQWLRRLCKNACYQQWPSSWGGGGWRRMYLTFCIWMLFASLG